MTLPAYFQFSQSSLQDFDACPRRFKLRYLDKLRWPAIESEPVEAAERLAELGQDFHRLVQQHLAGLEVEMLDASLGNAAAELQRWWQNYLAHRPADLAESQIYPELTLSTPLRGYRLLARFDALVAQPDGTFVIIDWKTSEQKPARELLEQRMQTRVYPYVLATAGTAFNSGQPIKAAAIKMIYWYPQYPDEPEIFNYNQKLLRRDERLLSELVEQVKQAAEHNDFPLVESPKPCTYCIYRSLCNRGVQAGPFIKWAEDKTDETDVLALEWEQIAEVQF